MLPLQKFKNAECNKLPTGVGVYALCDLDDVPIYVGQSIDGIRPRVRRHLTSARSDVIANRQIDVWEIAFVRAWEVQQPEGISKSELQKLIDRLECRLFCDFDAVSPLVNGDVLKPLAEGQAPDVPAMVRVQVMPDEEIKVRKEPALRFPRQIQHFNQLVDYILNTQDKPHLRRALKVYFDRLDRYYKAFLGG